MTSLNSKYTTNTNVIPELNFDNSSLSWAYVYTVKWEYILFITMNWFKETNNKSYDEVEAIWNMMPITAQVSYINLHAKWGINQHFPWHLLNYTHTKLTTKIEFKLQLLECVAAHQMVPALLGSLPQVLGEYN